MPTITLGSPQRRLRSEQFADGALVVRSRKGVRTTERALLRALPQGRAGAALVVNSAEALLAMALPALNPDLTVHAHYDDAFDLDTARATAARHGALAPGLALGADLPDGPWDLLVLPTEHDGPAALLRERLRHARLVLRPGGLLFASADNRRDHVLRAEVTAAFGSGTALPEPTRRGGIAYVARRPKAPAKPPKRQPAPFVIRHGDRELAFLSRPGVFCHGRLDPGTRALVDSNARAVQCARANVEAHALADRCDVLLSADARDDLAPGCDLVLTNPPYYSSYRVSELFLDTAARVLAPGGRILVVTKGLEWHRAAMQETFGNVAIQSRGGYAILTSVQAPPP